MNRFRCLSLALAVALVGCGNAGSIKAEVVAHPDKRGAVVEYFMKRPGGDGPWPTIVFLHGHQPPLSRRGGAAFVKWGVLDRFAKKGYLAISVSLPGYGGSSGPEDFAGPFTQHAVEAVIAEVEANHLAKHGKIVIQGVSLGAVTSALIMAHNPDIAGQVLISGLYDFPAFFSQPKSPGAADVKASMVAQIGESDAALQSRSALRYASKIKTATLVLNGAKDDRTDPVQAQRFAAAIKANGVNARVHIFPEFGHEIPVSARDAEIGSFIDSILRR